ncbi:MAG: nucleotidyltransferase domain-containing protein [Armatimonadetes bacterium]|nr:nucleotidyltransferase domain-containing protein [Armatimonadota bacterium]
MTAVTVKDEVVQRFLDAHLGTLVAEYRPEHMVLFGSRAVGTPREDSDIDLLIVAARFRETKSVDRHFRVRKTLGFPLGLDLLCYTPEEFEQLRDGFGLVADICREGIWLL